MLSLIEVKCPHCGAQGQIMLPPLGAIIIGPCPECEGMVVVFCGRVLPLDKETMASGSVEEKRDHLMEVLASFLQDRIERLFMQAAAASDDEAEPADIGMESDTFEDFERALDEEDPAPRPQRAAIPITTEEMQSFIETDLKLLDNKDYFKAVFE